MPQGVSEEVSVRGKRRSKKRERERVLMVKKKKKKCHWSKCSC